jgi:hypothetical protein
LTRRAATLNCTGFTGAVFLMIDFDRLFFELFESNYAWAHFPYVLLVLFMRNIVWLRAIAIGAGLSRVIIRAFVVYDPVTVLWELALVLINVAQLLILWWDSRHAHMEDDQRVFVSNVMPLARRSAVRRLLGHAKVREVGAGDVLTREGEPVPDLLFVTDGAARVERGGQMVATCSRGDFVGEMSFITGSDASATVVAEKPMRMIAFDSAVLKDVLARNEAMRHAFESSFNRNLAAKLGKSPAAGG